MQYRLATLLALTALACGTTPEVASESATATRPASEEATTGDELELSADTTTPAELRARVEHPLVRPTLAQITRPPISSWVFAAHLSRLSSEERRPALEDANAEPQPNLSAVTSDPVGRELITTVAEADTAGARLRYVP